MYNDTTQRLNDEDSENYWKALLQVEVFTVMWPALRNSGREHLVYRVTQGDSEMSNEAELMEPPLVHHLDLDISMVIGCNGTFTPCRRSVTKRSRLLHKLELVGIHADHMVWITEIVKINEASCNIPGVIMSLVYCFSLLTSQEKQQRPIEPHCIWARNVICF